MSTSEFSRGKIKVPPCREVIDNIIKPGIESELSRSFKSYLLVNKAHVVMLKEKGILSEDEARRILAANEELLTGSADFEVDYEKEDIYFNIENYVIARTGREIGGKLHTARSRNDLCATVTRISLRERLLEMAMLTNELREVLLDLAQKNTSSVMPGHTHLQPSEPITFAHYCSAIAAALQRDFERLIHTYHTTNICPLGGTSMGSSTFAIDRTLTSDLLGFNGPIENSLDCVASRDYVLEGLSALSIMGNTLSRLANDLYVWATPYYQFIEVDDSVAACSSIMPQKKNPWTLEYIKGKAAHLEGYFVSASCALRATPYTHCQDASAETPEPLYQAVDELRACLELMKVTLKTLKTNSSKMLQAANNTYCTVTELANTLVRVDGISFRSAHHVVALVVDHMLKQGLLAHEIKLETVQDCYQLAMGEKSRISEEDLQNALNPIHNVESKDILGGPAASEVTRQLQVLDQQLKSDQKTLKALNDDVDQATERLNERANKIFKAD